MSKTVSLNERIHGIGNSCENYLKMQAAASAAVCLNDYFAGCPEAMEAFCEITETGKQRFSGITYGNAAYFLYRNAIRLLTKDPCPSTPGLTWNVSRPALCLLAPAVKAVWVQEELPAKRKIISGGPRLPLTRRIDEFSGRFFRLFPALCLRAVDIVKVPALSGHPSMLSERFESIRRDYMDKGEKTDSVSVMQLLLYLSGEFTEDFSCDGILKAALTKDFPPGRSTAVKAHENILWLMTEPYLDFSTGMKIGNRQPNASGNLSHFKQKQV